MITRIFLFLAMSLAASSYADQFDSTTNHRTITAHLDMAYMPIGAIKFTNDNASYDFYDNLAYRFSIEYHLSELISIGPGFEYLAKNVNPYAYFDDDITLSNYYLDCRFNHSLIDSGSSYMIFGVGTGFSRLEESNGGRNNGFCLYGMAGFDIALCKWAGIDLFYRYQVNEITIDDRIYRFNGSVIQAGLNYRFWF